MADFAMSNVCKSFDNQRIINNLSLKIDDGKFVVLLGPSGCGKSTLLRLIAGLEETDSGEIKLDNNKINDLPPQKRNIAMVFQSYALFPHMTVEENLAYGPRVRGERIGFIGPRIKHAADVLRLQDHLHKKPGELSGGQRQRVAMGRAMMRDPKLFLFDEPLSNLDSKLRTSMRTEIISLHQRLRTTVVYVTHDQMEAMTLADEIAVMDKGEIVQSGDPLSIYDYPVNLFVAGFVGSPEMNFLPCTTAYHGSSKIKLRDGTEFTTAYSNLGEKPIIAGIRPEHFKLDPDGPISLRVAIVEPTGPEVHLYGDAADNKIRIVLKQRILPNLNDVLRFSVNPEHIHLFDTQSGKRLQL